MDNTKHIEVFKALDEALQDFVKENDVDMGYENYGIKGSDIHPALKSAIEAIEKAEAFDWLAENFHQCSATKIVDGSFRLSLFDKENGLVHTVYSKNLLDCVKKARELENDWF